MDVVAHAGPVGRRVVVAVDQRRLPLEEHVEDLREQVVRAGVVQVCRARTDDVEVAQRRVLEAVGALGVAQQPLADQLASRRTATPGRSRVASVTRSTSGVPYVAALEEKTTLSTPAFFIARSREMVAVTFCS